MTLKVDAGPASVLSAPRFLDAGEAALVVEFGDTVDPAINDRVLAIDAALRADPPAGTREFVPTYRSLMIHYDPLQIDRDTLVAIVRPKTTAVAQWRGKAATWTLPCCYDPALAEDLDEAARILGLTQDEAIALHAKATYRVYMCGFARIIETDVDFATFLLEEANVAVVPGSAFGLAPFFRISFATATERLRVACERITNACGRLS
jgi:inhibitor of KinA